MGTLGVAGAANAGLSNVVFEYTYDPYLTGPQQLILNGSTVIDASYMGWYDQNGAHSANNPDYLAGTCGSSDACFGNDINYNDFFVFDLSNITFPITSATLSLFNPSAPPAPGPGFLSIKPLTYTNWDVTSTIRDVIADQSTATDIYTDLGSGIEYGSVVVTSADNGAQVLVDLNSDALLALNEATGGLFAIGGSVTSPVPTEAPEPLTLSLIGGGLAGIAAARRRKNKA